MNTEEKTMLLEKIKSYDIVLASTSPRRKQLLEEMGLQFSVEPVHVEEEFPTDLLPDEIAEFLSRIKAEAFPEDQFKDNTLIITADTVVTLEGKILGKPENKTQAIEILQQLSGKMHEVITGVTFRTKLKQHTFSVSTKVVFKPLDPSEIGYYIDIYKPFDKAGAYGIQEWIGHVAIEKIEGSYFNVMGLPTHQLYRELLMFI
jgi:nucleoside triphosphate pyrophosphatase